MVGEKAGLAKRMGLKSTDRKQRHQTRSSLRVGMCTSGDPFEKEKCGW